MKKRVNIMVDDEIHKQFQKTQRCSLSSFVNYHMKQKLYDKNEMRKDLLKKKDEIKNLYFKLKETEEVKQEFNTFWGSVQFILNNSNNINDVIPTLHGMWCDIYGFDIGILNFKQKCLELINDGKKD